MAHIAQEYGDESVFEGHRVFSTAKMAAMIEYLTANTAIGPSDAIAEVERYIAVPGQALSYKVGELKFKELRARAQKALGGKFDIKEFHRQLLIDGALPLDVLDAKVDRWISTARGKG